MGLGLNLHGKLYTDSEVTPWLFKKKEKHKKQICSQIKQTESLIITHYTTVRSDLTVWLVEKRSNRADIPDNSLAFSQPMPKEKYLSKIPHAAPAFYLHPKKTTDAVRYITSPLGVNLLATMLPQIRREAGRSRIYPNHCLRATAVQRLPDAGLESKEIRSVTGHR